MKFLLKFCKFLSDDSYYSQTYKLERRMCAIVTQYLCFFTSQFCNSHLLLIRVALRTCDSARILEKGVLSMTKFIESNGIQLAYDETGAGDKTLILLHGITTNRHNFDGLIRAGLGEHYHLLRVDLRGRGESDKPKTGYHMRDHAADILEMMDRLKIEKTVLVGHSFGGLLSVFMAAHSPERLEKIVIIDAAREATTEETAVKIRPSLERLKMPIPSADAMIAAVKSMPYYVDGSWSEDLENMYRSELELMPDGTYQRRIYGDGILEAMDKIIADDWYSHFRNVKVPTLLIHAPAPFGGAGASPIVSLEGAEETCALIPNCQYKQVTGHHITMVFGDNAPKVVEAIREFVG
jgi:pimeloyl-ACP methyl ester carboxylesterase